MAHVNPKVEVFTQGLPEWAPASKLEEKKAKAYRQEVEDKGGIAWINFFANQDRNNPISHAVGWKVFYFTKTMLKRARGEQ